MKRYRAAAALLAASLLAGSAFAGQVAYADATTIDKDVELTQSMFMERRTVPVWLLSDLSRLENKTITLTADFYAVSFDSETVGKVFEGADRYDLTIKRLHKDIDAFHNAVGRETPKYVLDIPFDSLPGAATVTLTESHFMPGSQVHLYRYVDDLTFDPVSKFIPVAENGDVSFTVDRGGKYLVSSRQVKERLDGWDFERGEPIQGSDDLLTYLNNGSRYDFSGLFADAQGVS